MFWNAFYKLFIGNHEENYCHWSRIKPNVSNTKQPFDLNCIQRFFFYYYVDTSKWNDSQIKCYLHKVNNSKILSFLTVVDLKVLYCVADNCFFSWAENDSIFSLHSLLFSFTFLFFCFANYGDDENYETTEKNLYKIVVVEFLCDFLTGNWLIITETGWLT